MKKVEIILGNEKHVLVPDGENHYCREDCSLYACCEYFGISTLCGILQDVEDYEEGHFVQVPF